MLFAEVPDNFFLQISHFSPPGHHFDSEIDIVTSMYMVKEKKSMTYDSETALKRSRERGLTLSKGKYKFLGPRSNVFSALRQSVRRVGG